MRYTYFALALILLTAACGRQTQPSEDHSNHATSPANNSARLKSHDHEAGPTSNPGHAIDSSPGSMSAPFELQFLDTMIAHHKAAVEMAALAETRAQRFEIKELAASIVFDQEREIGKMAEWRNNWFDGKAEAVNMQFPGMSHGMQGMDMKKLASLKGNEFDIEFLRQMIPHHEGAIEMANAVKASPSRPELKELADDIISAQQAEIEQMRRMR